MYEQPGKLANHRAHENVSSSLSLMSKGMKKQWGYENNCVKGEEKEERLACAQQPNVYLEPKWLR
jgi:hypothetical protein